MAPPPLQPQVHLRPRKTLHGVPTPDMADLAMYGYLDQVEVARSESDWIRRQACPRWIPRTIFCM